MFARFFRRSNPVCDKVPAMTNVNLDDLNQVNTALPCCTCEHWKRDAICRILAQTYLKVLAGQVPTVAPLDVLMKYCCKSEYEHPNSVTYERREPLGSPPRGLR